MAGKYDAVIAAAPHIADIFSKSVEPSRLHVIYNYTTLEPASTPSWDEKQYDAVYAGLINDSRCAFEMVEAADVVRKHMPDFRMLLVGPSPDTHYRKKLASRIKTLRLQENVILKEPVPFSEMEQLLLQCRVGLGLFKPIRLFQYGIQVKTFEYMACGLPVICSHRGTIHDIVSQNACGISVDPSSAEETGQALVRMLTDRSFYLTCSRNGRNAVKEKYNWAGEERKLIGVYERMLDT